MFKIYISFILLLISTGVYAQSYRVPMGTLSSITTDKVLERDDTLMHLAIKPYWVSRNYLKDFESELINGGQRKVKKRFIGRKLFDEHFVELDKPDFHLMIDPLMEIGSGRDLEANDGRNLTTNIRGIQFQGAIGEKVSFYTSYYECQSFLPTYLDTFVQVNSVVPGYGRVKNFKSSGYDYNLVTGLFRYSATPHLHFTFGQDKLFFGHGYRSLLLSDNTFSYPFLGIDVMAFKNKIHYNSNLVWLQMIERTPLIHEGEALLKRKQANFHYLSYKPSKRIEVGLFEGITWKRWDDQEGSVDVNSAFYLPVLFSSYLFSPKEEEYSRVSGLNINLSLHKGWSTYGQLAVSDDGTGWQGGMKFNAPFGWEAWFFQGEYNTVKEGLYNSDETNAGYLHYGQGLATPLQDYSELVGVVKFHKNYIVAQGKVNMMEVNSTGSGKESIQILQGELGYILNPKYNLMFYVGGLIRNAEGADNTLWGFGGIKTSLTNQYNDF